MDRKSLCRVLGLVAVLLAGTPALGDYPVNTLISFNGANGNYATSLVSDTAGNMYGTTAGDYGVHNYGTVFEIPAGTQTLNTLTTFDGTNGRAPDADLIFDPAGNLYGTTHGDGNGATTWGTVFELTAGTHTLNTLVNFNGANGGNPVAPLVTDAAGNMYGTTNVGGDLTQNGGYGDGTVFKVAAGTHSFSTLVTFHGPNGNGPAAGLVSDAAGNFYGTTFWGGANVCGTVFELSGTNHQTLTNLVTFDLNGVNGAYPQAGVIFDAAGDLYGTTMYGGAYNHGTVFEIAAGTYALTTLASFNGADDARPAAGLIFDAAGNLYGTTWEGGANDLGTVFEVATGTHALTTLATFNGVNGANPACLMADISGNLYGTTAAGGVYGDYGTVFELSGTGFVVPEPASLATLAFGVVGLLARRRMCVRQP